MPVQKLGERLLPRPADGAPPARNNCKNDIDVSRETSLAAVFFYHPNHCSKKSSAYLVNF